MTEDIFVPYPIELRPIDLKAVKSVDGCKKEYSDKIVITWTHYAIDEPIRLVYIKPFNEPYEDFEEKVFDDFIRFRNQLDAMKEKV